MKTLSTIIIISIIIFHIYIFLIINPILITDVQHIFDWQTFWIAIGSIGTVITFALALFKEEIISRYFWPKLKFKSNIIKGHITLNLRNEKLYWVNHELFNKTPNRLCKNISIQLKSILMKNKNEWLRYDLPAPSLLHWSGHNYNNFVKTFKKAPRFDFLYITNADSFYIPVHSVVFGVKSEFPNIKFYIPRDQDNRPMLEKPSDYIFSSNTKYRFILEFIGDDLPGTLEYTIEVFYNGIFVEDESKMQENCKIEVISSTINY